MMKIDFAIFVCLYPVCTNATKYILAARYKMLGWEHYETALESKIWSVINFLVWVSISAILYLK